MRNYKNSNSSYRLENAASMRVQLIQHPELEEMSQRAVEVFEILYQDYVVQLRAQGSRVAVPINKAMCVTRENREIIAMERGVTFADLTQDMILDYLDELKGMTIKETQFDLNNVFKGIRMRPAKYVDQMSVVTYEYIKTINERKNVLGLESRFATGDKELNKMSFPSLIKGIWPPKASSILFNRWKAQGKQWKLSDLIKEIRHTVNTYGVYELQKDTDRKGDHEGKIPSAIIVQDVAIRRKAHNDRNHLNGKDSTKMDLLETKTVSNEKQIIVPQEIKRKLKMPKW